MGPARARAAVVAWASAGAVEGVAGAGVPSVDSVRDAGVSAAYAAVRVRVVGPKHPAGLKTIYRLIVSQDRRSINY